MIISITFSKDRQYREMKDYIYGIWYLFAGHDTSVRNKGTTVSLLAFDSEIRFLSQSEFINLQMGQSNNAKIILLDHVMDHFAGSTNNNQVLVISKTDIVSHWHVILFEQRVRVHSLRMDTTAGAVLGADAITDADTQSVVFQSLETLGEAGRASLDFMCHRPEPIDSISEIPTEEITPPSETPKIEKCSFQMEIYIFYAGASALELSRLTQALQQIVNGQLRHATPISRIDQSEEFISEMAQKHPDFVPTMIFVNFELEIENLKSKLDILSGDGFSDVKKILITNVERAAENPLMETELFVTKSIQDLVSNFEQFSEFSNEMCQTVVIEPPETEFDRTEPIVPVFVDQYKEPKVEPENLCQIVRVSDIIVYYIIPPTAYALAWWVLYKLDNLVAELYTVLQIVLWKKSFVFTPAISLASIHSAVSQIRKNRNTQKKYNRV